MSPSGSSATTSTQSTRAPRGPSRMKPTRRSTASRSPSNDRLDAAVGQVPHPAGDAGGERAAPGRLAEEDALDVTLDDDAPALHGSRLERDDDGLRRAARRARGSARTFNQYADSELRRARLARYLRERGGRAILLVGEAPGYRGARVSGIPFTSERQLTGSGPAEATATIVHRTLAELGLEDDVLLWNLVPTHPGTRASNRPPTRPRSSSADSFLARARRGRRVVAVGRLAHARLGGPYVRHPSHGGAAAFRAWPRRDTAADRVAAVERFPVRRNTILLAATLTSLSGMVQLAVAVGTVTLVLVTGHRGDPRARPGDLPHRRRARGAPRRAPDGPVRPGPGARGRLRRRDRAAA